MQWCDFYSIVLVFSFTFILVFNGSFLYLVFSFFLKSFVSQQRSFFSIALVLIFYFVPLLPLLPFFLFNVHRS